MPNQTIGVTGVEVFPQSPTRASVTLRNESVGGQIIGILLGSPTGLSTTNRDYVLRPTEAISFSYLEDGEDMRQQISAISDVAAAVLVKAETSFKKA